MNPRARSTNALPRIAAVCVFALCVVGTTLAGIQGSGYRRLAAFGVITETGDVTVNGKSYRSGHARVFVDGMPADKNDLRAGQVVTINGGIDASETSAVADTIAYVADVRGPVTSVDAGRRTFTVVGQVVRITDATSLDIGSATALAVGDQLEVSGYPNASGELVASRVVSSPPGASAQLRGVLAALDRNAHTFLIGAALVDYESASVSGALVEGAPVFIQGTTAGTTLLVANRVDVLPPLGTPGDKGDVESIITSYASAADFDLASQHVIADEKTQYVLHGGSLGPDVMVHVKGRFAADGTLVADKVERLAGNAPAQTKAGKPRKKP